MADFHERLARIADQARALEGGGELAHALMQLDADMDAYLDRQLQRRHETGRELFTKWNDFLNASVEDAHRYYRDQMETMKRRLARAIAADPRWQGGYADALALSTKEDS